MRTIPLPTPPAADCLTCRHGCDCTPTDPGCGHYGCWGADRTPATCPGAVVERQRESDLYAARRATIATADRIRARLADTYSFIVATSTL